MVEVPHSNLLNSSESPVSKVLPYAENRSAERKYIPSRIEASKPGQETDPTYKLINTLLVGMDTLYEWNERCLRRPFTEQDTFETNQIEIENINRACLLVQTMDNLWKSRNLRESALALPDWIGTTGKLAENASEEVKYQFEEMILKAQGAITSKMKERMLALLTEDFSKKVVALSEVLRGEQSIDEQAVMLVDDPAELELLRLKFQGVHHDLRIPFNATVGWIKVARSRNLPLSFIYEELNGGAVNFKEILEGRNAEIRNNFEKEPIPADELCSMARSYFEPLTRLGISVDVEMDPDLPASVGALWNRAWAKAVFLNLSSNAVKAMGIDPSQVGAEVLEGMPVQIVGGSQIKVRVTLDDNNNLCVVYEDRGKGLPRKIDKRGEFVTGEGGWRRRRIQSNRVGMADQTRVVKNNFEGYIRAQNVKEGRRVLGARVLVGVPSCIVA